MPGSAVRRFGPTELERFLEAVDRNLTVPAELIVLGGGALALGFGVEVGTQDIDTFNSTTDVEAAAEHARQETGLHVPLGRAGVADPPYAFEDRLQRAMPHLEKLTIRILEKHDLALSKIVRGDEHDMQHIEALHDADPLDRDVLIERFIKEMSAAIGNPRMIALGFLVCIDRLFGEKDRAYAEKMLRQAGRL